MTLAVIPGRAGFKIAGESGPLTRDNGRLSRRSTPVEFQTFDAEYVRRLTDGDPETESHFSTYFGKLLALKLRSRRIDPARAEDVRQETLYRVLRTLRQGGGVAHPERFGAFVNAVCNNVLLERRHAGTRESAGDEPPDVPDRRMAIDDSLISAERRRLVRAVLDELSAQDREILRLVFFEDADRREISRSMGVAPDYLRVLLHRARLKFESAFRRRHGAAATALLLLCNGMLATITILRGLQ
jgi:RNA polymerase sigma-70 factor (ECF subfamily)